MYGAQVMGATRLQMMQENENSSRVNRTRYNDDYSLDTSGNHCLRYLLFYLFITAVFVQVWVVVATSANQASIIITAILTFLAIIVLARRHYVTSRSYQEEQMRRLRERSMRQNQTTIMLRPLGLSMRNIPEIPEGYSTGVSRSQLLSLPTFTYTPLSTEDNNDCIIGDINPSHQTHDQEMGYSTENDCTQQASDIVSSDNHVSDGKNNDIPNRIPPSARSTVCIVCLTDYVRGDQLVLLPCGHDYHQTCVFTWLASHRLCPVCKQEVTLKPPQEPANNNLSDLPSAIMSDGNPPVRSVDGNLPQTNYSVGISSTDLPTESGSDNA